MTASAKFLSVFSLIVLFAVAPASAGVLSASGSAFEGWSGTTPFSNASGLAGDVDWVVLTSSNFSASFPGAAYSPPSDELVYVYQIVNTGSVAISSFSLPVRNDASMIGHFEDVGAADVTGGGPNASSLTTDPISGRALWDFSTDAIGAGVNSLGLVFSSPNTPINIFSTVVDGGTKALDVPVPTPSDVQIPEPSTFILMMQNPKALCHLSNWNKPDATVSQGNLIFPDSTSIDFLDLTFLLSEWTGSAPAGSPEAALGTEAVPEPSTMLLALLATLGLSFYRRRRRRAF